MATTAKASPRSKKLDRIKTNIAMFAVKETYTDEEEAQRHLAAAIKELEQAQAALIETE